MLAGIAPGPFWGHAIPEGVTEVADAKLGHR
jgi:hypothetical protein